MRKASSTNSLLHLTSATGQSASAASAPQPPAPAGSPTHRSGASCGRVGGGGPFSSGSGAAEGGEGGCQETSSAVAPTAPIPLHPGGVGAMVPGRSRSPGPEQYRQVSSILGPKLYVVASGQGSPCMDFRWDMFRFKRLTKPNASN